MSYKYEHVEVARVIDGDTVVLDIDMGNRITWTGPFRLAGINAPEMGRPGAKEARAFLLDLLKGQEPLGAEFEAIWDANVADLYEP